MKKINTICISIFVIVCLSSRSSIAQRSQSIDPQSSRNDVWATQTRMIVDGSPVLHLVLLTDVNEARIVTEFLKRNKIQGSYVVFNYKNKKEGASGRKQRIYEVLQFLDRYYYVHKNRISKLYLYHHLCNLAGGGPFVVAEHLWAARKVSNEIDKTYVENRRKTVVKRFGNWKPKAFEKMKQRSEARIKRHLQYTNALISEYGSSLLIMSGRKKKIYSMGCKSGLHPEVAKTMLEIFLNIQSGIFYGYNKVVRAKRNGDHYTYNVSADGKWIRYSKKSDRKRGRTVRRNPYRTKKGPLNIKRSELGSNHPDPRFRGWNVNQRKKRG